MENDKDWNEFEFPLENSKSNSPVLKYILFASSALIVPTLFILVLFKIDGLEDNKPTSLDTLVRNINKGGLKIEVNGGGPPKDPKVTVNIPPITVNVNDGKPTPPPPVVQKITPQMVQLLIDEINNWYCDFCSQNFDSIILTFNKQIDTPLSDSKANAELIEFLQSNRRSIKEIGENRIRWNAMNKTTGMVILNPDYIALSNKIVEDMHKLAQGLSDTSLKPYDKSSTDLIKSKKSEMQRSYALVQSTTSASKNATDAQKKLIYDSVNFLFDKMKTFLVMLEEGPRKVKIPLEDNEKKRHVVLGKLNKERVMLESLKSKCELFSAMIKEGKAFVSVTEKLLKAEPDGDFAKQYERLNEMLERYNTQQIALEAEILEARSIKDADHLKDVLDRSCSKRITDKPTSKR